MKKNKLNVKTLGQVFTQDHTVDLMLSLRKNKHGSVLEPSCGNGAFSNKIKNCKAIEFDKKVCPDYAENIDFFSFREENKYNTIIGNPPFVVYKDICNETKKIIREKYGNSFDGRTNLYMLFIYKCLYHMNNGDELIFITPREFLKATSSLDINKVIYDLGTITDFIDLGDARLFGNFTPNCVIWRFEKGNMSRTTNFSKATLKDNKIVMEGFIQKTFCMKKGQLFFTKEQYTVPFNSIFYVKVGAVSGADELFASEKGNKEFITSKTFNTGKTKKFFYNVKSKILLKFKSKLIKRKIKKFDETNWYQWGRNLFSSNDERIYVNCKTRQKNPFFTHFCKNYDGSVLGIFPKNKNINIENIINDMNEVDWDELGFVCGNRFLFSQKSLENCYLPSSFEKYLSKK